jgi:hypothetical protein
MADAADQKGGKFQFTHGFLRFHGAYGFHSMTQHVAA